MKTLIKLLTGFVLLLSVSVQASENIYFVQSDHLGTPEVLTDENQNIVWRSGQDPFGGSVPLVEQITFNVRFPGQYYDAESGLHYNWNRYYDAGTGRYVTSDPIGLDGGKNTYAYVSGNPLISYDLHGLYGSFHPIGPDGESPYNPPSGGCPDKSIVCKLLKEGNYDTGVAYALSKQYRDNVDWNSSYKPVENFLYVVAYKDYFAGTIGPLGHNILGKPVRWLLGRPSSPISRCAIQAAFAAVPKINWTKDQWRQWCEDGLCQKK